MRTRKRTTNTRGVRALALALLLAYPCLAQVANQITDVSPSSAIQGASAVTVTFTLDTDTPAPPPANVPPESATIGTISGTSVTHVSQYVVTAVFAIPAGEAVGAKDATVTFTTPNGSLSFGSTGGFTVTASGTSPPAITQQPQSRGVAPGGSATFTVVASGSGSLAYQWQKDGTTITSATSASYTIASVAATDAGDYTCVVSNDYGSATSNAATLTVTDTPAYEGYNLFTPLQSNDTYLMDNDGNVLHTWTSSYSPALSVYLQEDGTLLRTAGTTNTTFSAGGAGGRVERFDWDGNRLWTYSYSNTEHCLHHDIEELPNGNVLMIAWELKTQEEALAAGRDADLLAASGLWPDSIIEVEPSGTSGGTIVWEWHVWDHLIQDHDASKSNYGVVADHPELVDLNYSTVDAEDWTHINSVDYNPDLDQILLSVHNFGEVWIIDHSTTTAEAASHTGGAGGKGGDLLYRWGNPQTYGAGTSTDQQLFGQHDATWITSDLPGAGDILIFNNGIGRTGDHYSSVDEIDPPLNGDGSYTLVADAAYGPAAPTWSYTASPATDFYADHISGAQRLPNGNTLICDGVNGEFFEVTDSGATVWDYSYGSEVFRVTRYGPDYAGFDGTDLDDEVTVVGGTYPIVDTGQTDCYDASSAISAPAAGSAFYGQDAQHDGNQPSYTISGDGLTVLDNVTGLTWTRSPDWTGDGTVDINDKFTYADAQTYVATLNAESFGGYSDWRVPSTKELYSLIDYRGTDPNPTATDGTGLTPFIDDDVFEFAYGDMDNGDRIIDSQWVVSTLYVGTVMGGQTAMFGVNFADGRIKGYPADEMGGGTTKTFYARFCRGNTDYGKNSFTDNGDGTITDSATGLMWAQDDSGSGMNWEDALAYAQTKNGENYLGYSDWRLPNAKELQSLVDYTRSPDTTSSAAIDPLFNATQITNLAGQADYPWYWSSTSFLSFTGTADNAVYVCFGRGMGSMDGTTAIDVHGAGCQRSDQKDGNEADYPQITNAPQGDVARVFNYVRDAPVEQQAQAPTIDTQPESQTVNQHSSVTFSVVASGTAPLSYQWQKDGTDIDGATGEDYTFTANSGSDAGEYRCVVSNSAGSATSDAATLTLVLSPGIGTQPADQTVAAGGQATFAVVATGSEPLSYQWQKDSTDIDGATSATYTIASVAASDAGDYCCVVSNPAGTATSLQATLTVLTAPSIDTQPESQTVALGGAATFTVAASGTGTLSYQWQKDGAAIDGATNRSYTVDPASLDDAGEYRCVVTDDTGSTTSNPATLTVDTTSWTVTISVPDGSPQALILGVNPDATDGVDNYDAPVPPGPQASVGTAEFVLPDSEDELSQDIRGTLAGSEWWIYVDGTQATGYTTLSWSDQILPSENMRVQAVSGNDISSLTVYNGFTMESGDAISVGSGDALWLVIDENEAPAIGDASFALSEDSGNGTIVGTVSATDPNDVEVLTYSITGGNDDSVFGIDSADGTITVANATRLDAETTPSYELTVQVTDNGGLTDSATVTVSVLSGNRAPTLADATFTVDENSGEETEVGTLVATDPDGDDLTYAITAGNDDGFFGIDEVSGMITLSENADLNYEAKSSYSLTVTVTDDGGLSATATITIKVDNVNEAPAIEAATFSVAEDSAAAAQVGVLTAGDPEGGTVTYSITGGNSDGAFRIEADPTRTIYVDDASALDYETNPQYSLTVSGQDAAGNIGTAIVTIHITDANDAPALADTSFAVAEGCADETILGTVVGSDQDGDALVYDLIGGNDDGVFAIDAATGELSVVDAGGLDYGTTPEYSLVVEVADSDEATGTGTVAIHVCDGWVMTLRAAETTESVQFGVTSGATVGFDEGLDAEAAAALPQIAILPNDEAHGWLSRELQGSTNGSGWMMEARGGTDGLTLTWDPAALPRTGLQLEEVYTAADYRDSRIAIATTIDMSATTSLYIAPGNTRTLTITPILTEFQIDLWQGWNLASLPIEPDDPSLDAVLGDLDCWGPVWLWDPVLNSGNGSYADATEIHAKVGYWIYANCATTLVVVGSSPENTGVSLVAGWNLVGVQEQMALPDTASLATPFWYWVEALHYEGAYVGDTLLPGYGYWVEATEDTEITPSSNNYERSNTR
jgi:hypothetical protein